MADQPLEAESRFPPHWIPESEMPAEVVVAMDRWAERWPTLPLGDSNNMRDVGIHSMRFHSLPLSKQYPDSGVEYAEMLQRHSQTLADLIAMSESDSNASLIVMTRSWSTRDPKPTERVEWLDRLFPATYLCSMLADPDDEPDEFGQIWAHVYVSIVQPNAPELVSLFILVADEIAMNVAIFPPSLDWMYEPYDGGADVSCLTESQIEDLESAHPDWVPGDYVYKNYPREPEDGLTWEFESHGMSESAARRLAEVAEEENLLSTNGHVHDPRRTLTIRLNREDAQLADMIIKNQPRLVAEWRESELTEVSPEQAKAKLDERFSLFDALDEFLNEDGYRMPIEAVNGALPGKFWDPQHDYTGIDGTASEEIPSASDN